MANTHCKSCMFSKETNSDNPCDFGLIEIIKDHKEISVVDNFFYIKDYKCNYGFSEHIYTTNPELQKEIDIKNFILDKAKLQYYLVLDIRLLSLEEIKNEISIIKKLDIKPKFISFISSNEQKTSDIIKTIKSLLSSKNIDWKVHVFLNTMSLNDCINIAVETTISTFKEISVLVINNCSDHTIDINTHINYLHYSFRLIQDKNHCIMHNKDDLNMVAIYISLYKSIITTIGKNILNGINSIPDLNIGKYEIKESE